MSKEENKFNLKQEVDIKDEIKKVEKDKTLAQKLLPGAIFLVMSTVLGLSVYSVSSCDVSCVISGGGIGTVGIAILYIIGKGIKDSIGL